MGQCVGHFIWSTGCVSALAYSSLPEYNLQSLLLLLLRGSAIYFYTVCAVDTLCRWPIYCAVPGGDFWWYSWLIFLHSSSYSAEVHTVLPLNVLKIDFFVLAQGDRIKATCSTVAPQSSCDYATGFFIYFAKTDYCHTVRGFILVASMFGYFGGSSKNCKETKKVCWSQTSHDFCLFFIEGFHTPGSFCRRILIYSTKSVSSYSIYSYVSYVQWQFDFPPKSWLSPSCCVHVSACETVA